VLLASLPGADPSSIDVTVERNALTVRAERHFEFREGDELLVSERPQGIFSRQLSLGATIDTDSIGARYEGGVADTHPRCLRGGETSKG
jgi:HSP20 family protein